MMREIAVVVSPVGRSSANFSQVDNLSLMFSGVSVDEQYCLAHPISHENTAKRVAMPFGACVDSNCQYSEEASKWSQCL